MRSEPDPPVTKSANGPLTRSSIDVRRSRSRTLRGLVLQYLCHEIAGEGALAAGELPHEPLRITIA